MWIEEWRNKASLWFNEKDEGSLRCRKDRIEGCHLRLEKLLERVRKSKCRGVWAFEGQNGRIASCWCVMLGKVLRKWSGSFAPRTQHHQRSPHKRQREVVHASSWKWRAQKKFRDRNFKTKGKDSRHESKIRSSKVGIQRADNQFRH